MPIAFKETNDGRLLEADVSGTLSVPEYEQLEPHFEQLCGYHGRIRLLFILEDFHGWTSDSHWEELEFDHRHYSDIERLAIVGENVRNETMLQLSKPFSTAEVRYFSEQNVGEARAWIDS